jgi:predicted homoserine dehydrogenase-like protein
MIIVDNALKQRLAQGKRVRVGMVGAGYMGRGIAMQILSAMPGMRLVAIANRSVHKAEAVYRDCGVTQVRRVASAAEVDAAIAANEYAVSDDPSALCRAAGIEAISETTCDF